MLLVAWNDAMSQKPLSLTGSRPGGQKSPRRGGPASGHGVGAGSSGDRGSCPSSRPGFVCCSCSLTCGRQIWLDGKLVDSAGSSVQAFFLLSCSAPPPI